jgi:predicted RNA-binding Zn ribbon-like protein
MNRRPEGARGWPAAFVGGALFLDFINTVEYVTPAVFRDRLPDYSAVLRWSTARGSLPDRAIAKLAGRASRDPQGASAAWRKCIALREDLRELTGKLETGKDSATALAGLNQRILALPPLATLTPGAGPTRFVSDVPGRDLEEPTWPIIWSAAAVLTCEFVDRLGHCHAPPCRYVFIDLSRNLSRLWCDDRCGNRARVHRHQKRAKTQSRRRLAARKE